MIGVLSFGFTVKGMSISQGYSQKYFFIINLKSSVALRVLGQDPSCVAFPEVSLHFCSIKYEMGLLLLFAIYLDPNLYKFN